MEQAADERDAALALAVARDHTEAAQVERRRLS
jgi:hypothetical protein